jgi:hypothetical protein
MIWNRRNAIRLTLLAARLPDWQVTSVATASSVSPQHWQPPTATISCADNARGPQGVWSLVRAQVRAGRAARIGEARAGQ